jgi:hypothetical protein
MKPSVETAEAEKPKTVSLSEKKWLCLVAYSVALTILVLATVVAGAVLYTHYADKLDMNTLPSKVETYNVDGEEIKEIVQRDKAREVEIVRVPDSDSILVLDYLKSLIGLYVPEADECFLVGGINENLTNPFTAEYNDEDKVTVANKPERRISITYRRSAALPVVEPSGLLPAYLTELCSDRPVVWMELSTDDDPAVDGTKRKKRGFWSSLRRAVRRFFGSLTYTISIGYYW